MQTGSKASNVTYYILVHFSLSAISLFPTLQLSGLANRESKSCMLAACRNVLCVLLLVAGPVVAEVVKRE